MNPNYRHYHPRLYRPRTPIFWWLGKVSYTMFILRELTSLAVAWSAILLLLQIRALAQGEEAYVGFLELLGKPGIAVVNAVALLALLFHSVTWLNLAPKALVLKVRGRRIPGIAVLVGHYAAWFGASAVVIWYLVGS